MTISPKPLPIGGLAASNKTYDGTSTAALTGTATLSSAESAGSGSAIDGKPYTGDVVTPTGPGAASFADKHIGSAKPVTVSGFTLAGAQAANYSPTQPTGLTASIFALPVTVAAVTATKTYDGTTAAAGTPTITPALATGDTATALGQAFLDPNAGPGTKVLVPAITINDGNGGNDYAVTLQNFTTGTIMPATAAVALGGLTQTYDGNAKPATATTTPAGLAVNFTYNGSATAPTAVGNYTVIATIGDPDYAGSATGILIIAAQSIADWRTSHFTPAEISAGLAADQADPDGDGVTNAAEYILGTDPRVFSQQPLTITPGAANHFTLSFVARRASGPGYAGRTRSYSLQGTADPGNPASWQPVAGYTSLTGASQTSNITGDDQTIVATMPATAATRFYRLCVRVE